MSAFSHPSSNRFRESRTLALHKSSKLGRRTILDAKLTKQICDLLAAGNSIKTTMELIGRDESVYYDWINKGEQGQKPSADFAKKTSRARGKAKQRLVKTIVHQAPQDWRAAAWVLSHCWPQEFSEIVRNEVGLLGGVILMPAKEDKAP
jgi:hypothetical protein